MTAARLESIANRFVFSKIGMKSTSFKILKLLYKNGKMTPTQLLKYTGGTKSNISQRLSALERAKLITRHDDDQQKDRRVIYIKLSQEGSTKIEAIIDRFREPLAELEKHFTSAEIAAYRSFFQKLNHILDMHADEIPKCFEKTT